MQNCAAIRASKRSTSELDSDLASPALKRVKLLHASSLKENDFEFHHHEEVSLPTKDSGLTYRIVAPLVCSSSRKESSEVGPTASILIKTSGALKYRLVAPPPSCSSSPEPSSETGASTSSSTKTSGRLKYRVVTPFPSSSSPQGTSSSSSTTEPSDRPQELPRRLTIRIPPARRSVRQSATHKSATLPTPERPRKSKYITDPFERRSELARIPTIQFIECTPFIVFCRACQRPHELERRGTGWYAHNWVEGHEKTARHVKKYAKWVERGGDQVEREDEEVKWRCVYWKVWCEEEGKEVFGEKVVRKEDAEATEAMLKFWSSCGLKVDLASEDDMLEFVKREGKGRKKCRACKSRK